MRLRLIAVGSRMPDWVTEGFSTYARRLATSLKLELVEIEPGRRTAGTPTDRAVADEGARVLGALRAGEFVVALDEHGREFNTQELAVWLATSMQAGQDIAFVAGGADGLANVVLERANFRWSLSRLTLPHGLVRVVFAEQIYRAYSVLTHHPYHRE